MEPKRSESVTELLLAWRGGDRNCLDRLIPLVEDELRQIAKRYMRIERRGHTLQTTALVNETYLKLVNQTAVDWKDRSHFLGIAAQVMRQVLVDHARARCREKRGGDRRLLPLNEGLVLSSGKSAALLGLDDALNELAKFDARKSKVVELRYFGGMSVDETAVALGVHPNTVVNDWRVAKTWLKRELSRGIARNGS